jgi:hypothetical protein
MPAIARKWQLAACLKPTFLGDAPACLSNTKPRNISRNCGSSPENPRRLLHAFQPHAGRHEFHPTSLSQLKARLCRSHQPGVLSQDALVQMQDMHHLLLGALHQHGMLKGRRTCIDSSSSKVNASLRSLEHHNTEERYWEDASAGGGRALFCAVGGSPGRWREPSGSVMQIGHQQPNSSSGSIRCRSTRPRRGPAASAQTSRQSVHRASGDPHAAP